MSQEDTATTTTSETPINSTNNDSMSSQNSIGTNDRKLLLPNTSCDSGIGYLNPIASQSAESYHEDEKRLAKLEFGSRLTISTADGVPSLLDNNDHHHQQQHQQQQQQQSQFSCSTPNISPNNLLDDDDNQQNQQIGSSNETLRKTSLDDSSTQYLIGNMPSQDNLIDGDDCTGSCEPLFGTNQDDDDEDDEQDNDRLCDLNEQCYSNNYASGGGDGGNGNLRNYQDEDYTNLYSQQIQQVISNKSSKKIYKAVAKQMGITCKMNDTCRCMECQSNYFDCEYDQNDHQKTDGGLGATTPMFISEVMHGSACCIL